jgi:hypothetical protein
VSCHSLSLALAQDALAQKLEEKEQCIARASNIQHHQGNLNKKLTASEKKEEKNIEN